MRCSKCKSYHCQKSPNKQECLKCGHVMTGPRRAHSPGPWELDLRKEDGEIVSVVIMAKKERIGSVNIRPHLPYAANTRLIAAAPEMLEALQNIENDNGKMNVTAWGLVEKAISKATGKEESP